MLLLPLPLRAAAVHVAAHVLSSFFFPFSCPARWGPLFYLHNCVLTVGTSVNNCRCFGTTLLLVAVLSLICCCKNYYFTLDRALLSDTHTLRRQHLGARPG